MLSNRTYPLSESIPPERDIDRADQAFAQSLLPDRLEVAPAGEEGVDDVRVPLDVPPLLENLVDLREAEPLAVGAVARHGVERVGDRQDPGLERDVLAGEMVGIAGPVQAFVVVPHAGKDVVQLLQVLEDRHADLDVRLDLAILLGRQRARSS